VSIFHGHRRWLALAALTFVLYLVNMALRIAQIKFGVPTRSFGDVGEFLLVLLCMIFFVAGLLAIEARNAGVSVDANHPTTGGTQ